MPGTVGANGKTVTIATADGYSVTLVHLGGIGVSKGVAVDEGDVVGSIGPSGEAEHDQPYVHLGVRRTADPQGYLDPLGFLPQRGGVSEPPAPATHACAGPGATAAAGSTTSSRSRSHSHSHSPAAAQPQPQPEPQPQPSPPPVSQAQSQPPAQEETETASVPAAAEPTAAISLQPAAHHHV